MEEWKKLLNELTFSGALWAQLCKRRRNIMILLRPAAIAIVSEWAKRVLVRQVTKNPTTLIENLRKCYVCSISSVRPLQ